ncbi:MAG: FmdB family transcriptional regulator [Treponema sp.]|nr:FmdB family transcriptional regulator [Treponema sp.]
MPTYEYECKSCTHNFEVFQSMSEQAIKDCPECGKEVRRLIFGGTGVIFKGSGFYVNDKKSAKKESKTEKTESKPACPKASDSASCAKCPAAQTA